MVLYPEKLTFGWAKFRGAGQRDTRKVTIWGWISLAGIVVSSSAGIAAQIIETREGTVKEKQQANQFERNLERIDDPTVELEFEVPCGKDYFEAFCQQIQKIGFFADLPSPQWQDFPGPHYVRANIVMASSTPSEHWDLAYLVQGGDAYPRMGSLAASLDNGGPRVLVTLTDPNPDVAINDGRIVSFRDFDDAMLSVEEGRTDFQGLKIRKVTIRNKNGQNREIPLEPGPRLTIEKEGRSMTHWRYKIPPKTE